MYSCLRKNIFTLKGVGRKGNTFLEKEHLDPVTVGRVLAMFRGRKGLSQEVVSGLAGIGRSHLSSIERGERKPTMETFYRLSEALDVSASTILQEIEREVRAEEER